MKVCQLLPVLYVIFSTIYVLDKFCIQWLYYQQGILELPVSAVEYKHT